MRQKVMIAARKVLCIVIFVSIGWTTKGRFTHSMPCPYRAHAVPLPCRVAKGLEWVFPIWFTQCGRVWFTLATPCPGRAHSMLCPCRSSQGHGTARPSRDSLWATCPLSASSGYHAEFHEDCYQKRTNLSSQRTIPTTVKSSSSTLQKKTIC